MSDQKLKLLFFGRIGDDIDAFVNKLKALHGSKAGPFDAAFCVGSCNAKALQHQSTNLPIPVYLQEPLQDVESLIAQTPVKEGNSNDDNGDGDSLGGCARLSDTLFVLRNPTAPYGPSVWSISIAPKKPELVVAVCPSLWRMDDAAVPSTDLLKKLNHVSYTGCDLLLTTEWPQGVESTLEDNNNGISSSESSSSSSFLSFDVAQIALRARARYHVAVGDSFCQSHPFAHLAATTNTVACHHVGRFVSLGPVADATAWKTVPDKKKAKFVHALGLQPLHTMSYTEIQAQRPAQGLCPCPYTDESYHVDDKTKNKSTAETIISQPLRGGLSEAQARRILAEEQSKRSGGGVGGGHRFVQKDNRGGRGDEPETIDPTNQTLFVHGLHKDVTGTLQSARGDHTLYKAFARFGATVIRKPPNAETSSFAFVDFPSHEKALVCWTDLGGNYTVNGVDLRVRWATNKRKANDGDSSQQPNHKRRRMTEAEARDSSTIYFSMGPQFKVDAEGKILESSSERLRVWMEETLEEALAGDGERVKAADEPALQVQKRLPTEHSEDRNFGFLEFASHAAASMALATLTGSTDGGTVLPDAPGLPGKEFQHVKMHWGHARPETKEKEFIEDTESGFKFERKHFPADSRKDCWFCLASEACEKHLITGVYDQCYSAMPKGPIHPAHVLLVPVQHTSEGALKDAKLSEEIDRIKTGLREHASKEYDMDLFVFERAIQTKGGYHTHVQCIPVPRQRGSELRATMIAQGKRSNADIRELTSDLGLAAVMGGDDNDTTDEGYFYAEVPISTTEYRRFLYKATKGGSLPLQFGREVVATVLRKPDLAHWKSCLVDKEKETELALSLRESLAQCI